MVLEAPGEGTKFKNTSLPVVQYLKSTVGMGKMDASTTFTATECSLDICIKSIQPVVQNAVYSEEELELYCSSYDTTNSTLVDIQLDPPQSWEIQNRGLYPGMVFGLDGRTTLAAFIRTLFSGSVNRGAIILFEGGSDLYAASDALQAIYNGNFTNCANASSNDNGLRNDTLSCAMTHVADALTKSFRDSAYTEHGLQNGNMTIGRTMISVTFVRIEWWWMMLPALVWAMGVITWLGTAWRTRKRGMKSWWNNPLPLLFLYRETNDMKSRYSNAGDAYDVSDRGYQHRSERVWARLAAGKTDAKLIEIDR